MQDHEPATFVTCARAEQAATGVNRVLSNAVVSTSEVRQRGCLVGYAVKVRRAGAVVTVTEQQVKDWNL